MQALRFASQQCSTGEAREMSTTKRKQISLLDKLGIINDVDSGQKQTTVAEKFGLSRKTVNTIVKNREAILKQQEDGGLSAKRVRLRGASYPKVEEALLLWLRDALAKNIPVNGVLLRKRAEQLAFLFDCADFKCSEGWLDRFKARNSISFRCISGESDSVDGNCVSSWKESKLPQLLHGYSPDDVFNADESGLFYKMRPGKTMSFKSDACHGGKQSKERVSVLFCCNMSGTEKERLLVIGKSKRPRCFSNFRHIPVTYESNQNAWMTSSIFNSWLLKFDQKMDAQKRHVLLFVDNTSCHTKVPVLKATKVVFFPPNTTSHLQPIDQGVVHSVKSQYRTRLVERLLFDMQQDRATVIDVRFAVQVISAVWNGLRSEVVKNCFTKAGFKCGDMVEEGPHMEDPEDDGFENEAWALIQEAGQVPESFEDFVSADMDLVCSEELTDEAILAQVNGACALADEPEEEDEEDIAEPKVSALEADEHLRALQRYCEQQEGLQGEVFYLQKLGRKLIQSAFSKKQTSLKDFFQPS